MFLVNEISCLFTCIINVFCISLFYYNVNIKIIALRISFGFGFRLSVILLVKSLVPSIDLLLIDNDNVCLFVREVQSSLTRLHRKRGIETLSQFQCINSCEAAVQFVSLCL